MIVRWQVDDGYAGASRPQYTDIDDSELEECESEEERLELVRDYVQQDFEDLGWYLLGYQDVPEEFQGEFL